MSEHQDKRPAPPKPERPTLAARVRDEVRRQGLTLDSELAEAIERLP